MELTWKRTGRILLIWAALLVASIQLEREWMVSVVAILFIFVVVPLLVAGYLDSVTTRNADPESRPGLAKRTVGLVGALPALVFGATAILIGVAIIGWVLYNTFVERLPEYSGHSVFVSFGVAPTCVSFGTYTIYAAWQGERSTDETGGA